LNFGLAYGLGAKSLGESIGCSEEEAQKLYDLYFEKMPTTKLWITNTHADIANKQFSESIYGRVRKLPGARSTDRGKKYASWREGLNHKIQSTSADITKIAMVRCAKVVAPLGIRILLQVHDELLFEVPDSVPPAEAVALITKAMQLIIEGFVKLKVDASIGRNWGDCVDFDPAKGLEQIPEPRASKMKEIRIEGPIVDKGDELKNIFNQYPGECIVMLKVADTLIVPTDVDEETGEVTEVKVSITEEFLVALKNLGLKYFIG
jgi:hypothetical protein